MTEVMTKEKGRVFHFIRCCLEMVVQSQCFMVCLGTCRQFTSLSRHRHWMALEELDSTAALLFASTMSQELGASDA